MTARQLAEQWFQRHQDGVASNMRYVTLPQIDLLRILADAENREAMEEFGAPSAVFPGRGRSFTWMPAGQFKYVVTEGAARKHTILRLANLQASGAGTLFG